MSIVKKVWKSKDFVLELKKFDLSKIPSSVATLNNFMKYAELLNYTKLKIIKKNFWKNKTHSEGQI